MVRITTCMELLRRGQTGRGQTCVVERLKLAGRADKTAVARVLSREVVWLRPDMPNREAAAAKGCFRQLSVMCSKSPARTDRTE